MIKKLYRHSLISAAALLSLSACTPLGQDNQPRDLSQLDQADQMILNESLGGFTDFGSPYACLHSDEKPQAWEPQTLEPDDLWARVQSGYGMHWREEHPRIDAEMRWYLSHPNYLDRVAERAHRYLYHVVTELESRDLPLELALLPIVESAFDPFAYSHGRAAGLWQFIPSTGRHYGLNSDWWYEGRRDVVESTRAALDYLESLHKRFDGNWLHALASYNAGEGNVSRAIRRNEKAGKPTDFWNLKLPSETRSYVPKLLALAKMVKTPERYGLQLRPIPNRPYFAMVELNHQLDLSQAAEFAGVSIEEIYRLNPALNRWATPPRPYRLLVPNSCYDQLVTRLEQLPAEDRVRWVRYKVKRGDALLSIAKRYRTDVETLKQVNNLNGHTIRAGQMLTIPSSTQAANHYALSADQRLAKTQNRQRGDDRQQIFHTVTAGDSLWGIAKRYKVSVGALAKWNGMAPKDPIKPGQKLTVWSREVTATVQDRDPMIRRVGYTVRRGDSLAKIAARFNVAVSDITDWNKISPKRYLQPGQKLTLFVNVFGES